MANPWEQRDGLKGDVVDEVARPIREIDGEIVYDGGQLDHVLIEHELVDELPRIAPQPVLGTNERLFDESSDETPMRQVDIRTIGEGLALTYERARNV